MCGVLGPLRAGLHCCIVAAAAPAVVHGTTHTRLSGECCGSVCVPSNGTALGGRGRLQLLAVVCFPVHVPLVQTGRFRRHVRNQLINTHTHMR